MTLSVPYSFVPGTKAKAEEVNANFASILDKIEEQSSDTQEKFEELSEQKLNTDWSNLDKSAQAMLDDKADKTAVDGSWVHSYSIIAQNTSLNGSTNLVYNISGYLPDSTNIYEIIAEGLTDTGNSNGNYAPLYVLTDFMTNSIAICRARTRTASVMNSSGSSVLISGKGRTLTVNRANTWNGTFNLILHAYRKVS